MKTLVEGLGAAGRCSFHPVVSPLGYRNRIRLRVDKGGQPVFFNPEKSQLCPVLAPGLRRVLVGLRSACVNDPALLRGALHVELREPDLDHRAGLWVTFESGDTHEEAVIPAQLAFLRETLQVTSGSPFLVGGEVRAARRAAGDGCVVVSRWDPLPGSGLQLTHLGAQSVGEPERSATQRFPLAERLYYRVPLSGFMQVNSLVNRALVRAVVEGATARGLRAAVELYCGSGNFALPLAEAGFTVVGVEKNAQSIAAARRASEEQSLPGCYLAEDVQTYLESELASGRLPAGTFDLVVVDPPRSGLKAAVEQVRALRPQSIALCSCHPQAAASDLGRLCAAGYTLTSVTLFDMFAQTDHVELLAWLDRV